jgi:Zn-dependent protease
MKGFRIGSIAGFEISIDWSWFVIFFLIVYSLGGFAFPRSYPGLSSGAAWGVAVAAAILLFASVLAHEIMHSVVARQYGLDIKGITLFIFGGVSQISSEPKTAKIEFNMAIAGPLTSLALGGIFYGLWYVSTALSWPLAAEAILNYLGTINLALGIFNLIPGFPLDGGRVLRAAIWQWTHNVVKATRDASYVGQAFGYFLIAGGVFMIFYMGAVISGI